MPSAAPRPVVLTGDRPTGPLHLGHYAGSLRARLDLQAVSDQYLLIADMQALTDNSDDPGRITTNVVEVALDYLAVGIDPRVTTIAVQSQIPELAELTVMLLNYVTVARLERNPTIKDEIRLRRYERDIPAGFLAYPVAQAADITAFHATVVPVGEDQLPMIEQTNELVRRFNAAVGQPVLVECVAQLSRVPRLPGIDGAAKMSKSLGNAIALGATEDEIHKAVRAMYTDEQHLKVSDPGRIEGNVVFAFLDAFETDRTKVEQLKEHYRRGGLADSIVKQLLEERLQELIAPIRRERQRLAVDRDSVVQVLKEGTARARVKAAATVAAAKRALGLTYFV
jgi:tryptophanyl-tRNA synthetase